MLSKKFKLFRLAIGGELIKIGYAFGLVQPHYELKNTQETTSKIIVSLTSYGRRVRKTVHYTIISLLRQTMKPDKIILWLDKDNWNINNLPKQLTSLERYGLEIKFCEDYKSFKKLIPTLKEYRDSIIVTVDDDIFYSPRLIESLYNSYIANNRSISAIRVGTYEIKINEAIIRPQFQIGTGGVLYPPHSLNNEIFNLSVQRQLCPDADDIWFYFMGVLNDFNVIPVKDASKIINYELDLFYQKTHPGSRIYDTIRITNIKIIKNLINHYNIALR